MNPVKNKIYMKNKRLPPRPQALPRGAREEELLEPIKAVAASIKAVQVAT